MGDVSAIETIAGLYTPVITVGGSPVRAEIGSLGLSDLISMRSWWTERQKMVEEGQTARTWHNLMTPFLADPSAFSDYLAANDGIAFKLSAANRILGGLVLLPAGRIGALEIDLLQACPDSARPMGDGRRVAGVGTALVVRALQTSHELGHGGQTYAWVEEAAKPFYGRLQARYGVPGGLGLEFVQPDRVRFSAEGSIAFMRRVIGAGA